jgi:hypothetical protein
MLRQSSIAPPRADEEKVELSHSVAVADPRVRQGFDSGTRPEYLARRCPPWTTEVEAVTAAVVQYHTYYRKEQYLIKCKG